MTTSDGSDKNQIDSHRKRLLWVGRDRKAETLQGFFDWLGPARSAALYFVRSDMWKPYLKVVADRAQQTVITKRACGFRTCEVMEVALYHALGDLPERQLTHRFC